MYACMHAYMQGMYAWKPTERQKKCAYTHTNACIHTNIQKC